MADMARSFVENKMKAVYTAEDIDRVVEMIGNMMEVPKHE